MAQHQKIRPQTALYNYSGNKYKIRSVLISISILFFLFITFLVLSYFSNSPILQLGGSLLLDLTRIAFIIFATPVAIVTLFVGHRIDDAKNKTDRYPMWVELIGLITGIFFGWAIAIEWAFLLTLSLGTIWSDPFLYVPFPIFTSLITYLCFKAAHFLYSRNSKTYTESFRLPFLVLFFSLPLFLYSALALFSFFNQASSQNTITITNFKEIPQGGSYVFIADLTVPEDNLYHVTASVGPLSHPTSKWNLRLNGAANFDGLYNFELTKGTNTISYISNPSDCSSSHGSPTSSYVVFTVSKVLAGRFAMVKPQVIKENITCHQLQ